MKIIEALYRLSPGGPRTVTYEDIVVKAWELYPDEFGLRGYSESYPDASDVHKPLYNKLKSRGWVTTGPRGQKKFSLTRSGWERAQGLFTLANSKGAAAGRARRTTEEEIRHMERTPAAVLFMEGREEEILDTDFFDFYRTSVRATPQQFEGRLAQVAQALREAGDRDLPTAGILSAVDIYLRTRFASIVAAKSERKKREG